MGPVARMTGAIRREGWRQVPDAVRFGPPEVCVTIDLTPEQWEFIPLDQQEPAPLYSALGDRISKERSVLGAEVGSEALG